VCAQMLKCHISTCREKKELQKILERKRLNSIIEAKKSEKEMLVMGFLISRTVLVWGLMVNSPKK